MNQLIQTSQKLPANIEDLAKFVLVGREKLTSVRAEIRAIDKLNLAEEVRTQKKEEALMLSEALLDAEVRIGELTRVLPKSQGFASKPENIFSNKGQHCTELEKPIQKPKLEVIKNLGFSEDQVKRFETLANNPDIVEQVKAEARENDDLPTRSRVLQLVKEKKKAEQPILANRQEIIKIVNTVVNASNVPTDSELLKGWVNDMQDDEEINFNLMMIDDAIEKLQVIKAFITKNRR